MSAYRFEVTENQMEQIAIAIIRLTDSNGRHLGSPSWLPRAIDKFLKDGQCSITFEKVEDNK